jgi:hypothetical protein
MKAEMGSRDWEEAQKGWLLFSEEEAQMLRNRLLQHGVGPSAVNLIENAGRSHEFHECHETLSMSVAPFLALFVQFVAVLLLPKQEFYLKLTALGPSPPSARQPC